VSLPAFIAAGGESNVPGVAAESLQMMQQMGSGADLLGLHGRSVTTRIYKEKADGMK